MFVVKIFFGFCFSVSVWCNLQIKTDTVDSSYFWRTSGGFLFYGCWSTISGFAETD